MLLLHVCIITHILLKLILISSNYAFYLAASMVLSRHTDYEAVSYVRSYWPLYTKLVIYILFSKFYVFTYLPSSDAS
jgi:hypothetical protein